MSTKTKTLAKSLHTVTALAAVARYVLKHGPCAAMMSRIEAVEEAARLLGYDGAADPYGLKVKAAEALAVGGGA